VLVVVEVFTLRITDKMSSPWWREGQYCYGQVKRREGRIRSG